MPEATIDILLSSKNIGASQCLEDYINTFYCYEKNIIKVAKLIYNLKKENYDLVIDLFDNTSTTSTYLIELLAKKFSLGFDKENAEIYTHIVPLPDKKRIHIVERNLNLLLPFGVNPNSINPKLEYKLIKSNIQFALEKLGVKINLRVGINLAGSSKNRFWGYNNILEFVNMLKMYYPDCEVILFGIGEYIPIAEDIIKETKFATLAPKTKDINDFAAMLMTCDIVITPDTSATHFTSAFDIKCIGLFITSNEMPWTSYKNSSINIICESELTTITAKSVFEAFQKLI